MILSQNVPYFSKLQYWQKFVCFFTFFKVIFGKYKKKSDNTIFFEAKFFILFYFIKILFWKKICFYKKTFFFFQNTNYKKLKSIQNVDLFDTNFVNFENSSIFE